MKKLAFILASAALPLAAEYSWDFSQTPLAQDANHWAQNGTLAFGSPTTFSGSSGGSIVYNQTITGANSNDYEFDSTYALKSGGGAYIQYFRAAQTSVISDSGLQESCAGSYYFVEIDVPSTFNPAGTMANVTLSRCNSGTVSAVASGQASIADGMTTRLIVYGSSIMYFVNGHPTLGGTLPAALSGNPGLGGFNQPSGSGFTGAQVGHHDVVAPGALNVSTVLVSALPNQVNLQWAGTLDDAVGIGLFQYNISRGNALGQNMTFVGEAEEPEWSDDTAAANTTYTYKINAEDYHGNVTASISFTVNTPPAQAVDPRRLGVHPLGSYWGGAGEQVDTESMNLNSH